MYKPHQHLNRFHQKFHFGFSALTAESTFPVFEKSFYGFFSFESCCFERVLEFDKVDVMTCHHLRSLTIRKVKMNHRIKSYYNHGQGMRDGK